MANKFGVAVAALVLAIPLLISAQITGAITRLSSSGSPAGPLTCAPERTPTGTVPGLTSEQLGNAAIIVAVGKEMGVPEPGWVVAIAAALQESGLRNLSYGDRDSIGLFQQRPSMGWGTPEQVATPVYAATRFFEHLIATPDWQRMSVNDAAQAVQRSGFPRAYAKHEATARTVVAAVSGIRCEPTPEQEESGKCETVQAASSAARTAINYACGQLGLPYLWGGDGPAEGGFDRSGLTRAAYQAAGISLPRRAQTQHDAGPLLPPGTPLLPGDLVFFGAGPHEITHVGLAISSTHMINAPETGAVIRIDPVGHYDAASRPWGMMAG